MTAAVAAVLVLAAGCTGADGYGPAEGPPSSGVPTRHPLTAATTSYAVPELPALSGLPSRAVVPGPTMAAQAQMPPATTPAPVRVTTGRPAKPLPARTVTRTVTVTPAATPTRRHRPGWISDIFQNDSGDSGEFACAMARPDRDDEILVLHRLQPGAVCLRGFAADPAPKLVITAPSGARTTMRGSDLVDGWRWLLRPGAEGSRMDESGTYRYEVTGWTEKVNTDPDKGPAGERLPAYASGEITAVPGRVPYADLRFDGRAGWPEQVRPGARLTVRVAGYTPYSRVEITVYRAVGGDAGFGVFADLPDVITDRSGEGRVSWTLPVTAPPGTYGWLIAPEPRQPRMSDNGLSVYLDVVRR